MYAIHANIYTIFKHILAYIFTVYYLYLRESYINSNPLNVMYYEKVIITIEQLNSNICFSNTASYQTRAGDNVKEYEIAATTSCKR